MSLIGIILLALFAGSFGGIISLYIGAAVLSWVGGMFGGEASSTEVRAAIAWSSIPTILAMLLWIPELALYGNEVFQSVTPLMDSQPYIVFPLLMVELILSIWAFIIFLKCLGEVHGFSAWKALIVAILPAIVIFIPLIACGLYMPPLR